MADASPEERTMSRIVVGVDGSLASAEALRWAVDEARARQARLDVVMVWTSPTPIVATLRAADEVDEQCRLQVQEMLAADGLDTAGLSIHPRVLRGPAGPALVDAAGGADLLVVGSEGRGRFTGLLVGSVSLYCVSKAPCSVVVVPPPAAAA
jgi:nucleotide-binding universal stress UspA family protein